jgi:hypothetical protein
MNKQKLRHANDDQFQTLKNNTNGNLKTVECLIAVQTLEECLLRLNFFYS